MANPEVRMLHQLTDTEENDHGYTTHIEQPEVYHGDQFLSFARRSKVVQRQCSEIETEPVGFCPKFRSLSQKEEFQYRTLYQPSEVPPDPTTSYSPFQIQKFLNKPETAMIMAGARLAGQRGKTSVRQSLGKLPSPAELMGRKKKWGTVGAIEGSQAVQPRAATVLQHIGDLHRRQSSIDQLKLGSWWGSKPRCKPEEESSQRPPVDRSMLEAQLEPSLCFSTTTVQRQDESIDSLNPTLTYTQQERLCGGFKQASHLAPGGNPIMSFVLATADRQPTGGWHRPCLSHNEFWGIWHNPEE